LVFDKAFGEWKPEVNSSLTSIKLELSKLNTFFDRGAKATSTPKPSVLLIGSMVAHPSVNVHSDGPALTFITEIVGMGVHTPKPMAWSWV
jgi:hypothetical protein